MKRLLLALSAALTIACAHGQPVITPTVAAPATNAVVPPVVEPALPVVPPTPPVDPAHVRWFGYWQNHTPDTAGSTNFITLSIGCDDDAAFADAQAVLQQDQRSIVWFINVFGYGPTSRSRNGYFLRSDASRCWQQVKALIANYRSRTINVWLLDEPDSVAWGDMVPGGPYDPNLYNDIIATACAMVHADFPDLAVGLNYGGVPDGLHVSACLDVVGIESYSDAWADNLNKLEAMIPTPIWLLSPAYVDGDPAALDAPAAARVHAQFSRALSDARVTGIYPFLWGDDDTTTGDMSFYTVSGGHLPATRNALDAVGRSITGN